MLATSWRGQGFDEMMMMIYWLCMYAMNKQHNTSV